MYDWGSGSFSLFLFVCSSVCVFVSSRDEWKKKNNGGITHATQTTSDNMTIISVDRMQKKFLVRKEKQYFRKTTAILFSASIGTYRIRTIFAIWVLLKRTSDYIAYFILERSRYGHTTRLKIVKCSDTQNRIKSERNQVEWIKKKKKNWSDITTG